jgi:hypothetical protein
LLLPVLTLAATGAFGGLGALSIRWRRRSTEAAESLRPRSPRILISEDDFWGLPPVVERYLRRALPHSSVPSSVQIEQDGEFLLNGAWRTFHSTELFSVEPRGFLWEARIRTGLFVDVRVRDSSIEGVGSMQAALAGVVRLVNLRGGSLLNVGALQRYLAETPWLPVALLPRFGVRWEAIAEGTARATVTEGETTASLQFTFDDAGDVMRVYAPARPRQVGGRYELTPWAARVTNYQDRCEVRIPLESEVEWIVDGTPQPYFRGRIVRMRCSSGS